MSWAPGEKLGPYELVSRIGEGGMGEVWKARDTRLDRTVAAKVSKAAFTDRFDKEARAIAALNHPNICQLYDVGPNYLVMEFIEGAELKGPLPVEKAVMYGGQILDALEAAHKNGFTHRDLKPANVLVTKQGIKLLDFGLAKKALSVGAADATVTAAMTSEGTIAGTLQYMSPEQLQAREVDSRSDLFAFGCVLYEMLSGKRAFGGSSAASVIAAILEREPESLEVSAPLDRVIRTCLAKDPDERFQCALDLKRALVWAAQQEAATAPKRSVNWVLAAATLLLAAVAGYLAWRPTPKQELTRLEIDTPEGASLSTQTWLAMSPDGRSVAFVAGVGDKQMILLRTLSSGTARALPGTEGSLNPFWTPDGAYIGFCAGSQVKKIAVSGGPAQVLGEVPRSGFGSWSINGEILVMQSVRGPMYRVSASGGPVREASVLDASRGETSHRFPSFLPDGRHYLFLILAKSAANSGIFVGALDSNERTRLSDVESGAVYASGNLLYVRDHVLVAQPFDAGARKLTGEPVPVFSNISFLAQIRRGAFAVSENGNMVARVSQMRPLRQLTWVDRTGKTLETVSEPGDIAAFQLSPDGRRLAVSQGDRREGTNTLFSLDLARGVMSQLAKNLLVQGALVYSPDGEKIVLTRGRTSYLIDAASGAETRISDDAWVSDWSGDGKYLISSNVSGQMVIIPAADSGKPFSLVEGGFRGRFSPDGKWIAYISGRGGLGPVRIVPFTGGPSKSTGIQVSPGDGREPRWSRDGKELLYISSGNQLMATPVSLGPSVSVGIPKALIPVPAGTSYEVSQDGKRFLLNPQVGETPPEPPLTVLLNWPSILRRN